MSTSRTEVIDLTVDDTPPPSNKRKRKDSEHKRSRDRDSDKRDDTHPRSRKQKRESSPRDTHRDKKTANGHSVADEQLFVVDCTPAELPDVLATTSTVPVPPTNGLILPAHVSVFGVAAELILPSADSDSEADSDYIEYLDYDSRKKFVRYYEEEEAEEKKSTKVCKRCGETGHVKDKCPVIICQTCGARDEHSTRSCNVSKHCFNCGMRGHLRQDCPNRTAQYERMQDCERCGAPSHLTRECPTLWRLYVYLDDAEHKQVLQARQDKKGLPMGQGGEGYIAEDAWCYACGKRGHFGDDCHSHIQPPAESSAFSHRMLSQGPFAVPDPEPGSPTLDDDLVDVPLPGGVQNVGKQGRNKEKERLARRAKQEEEDDAEDWFQSGRGGGGMSIRGAAAREKNRPPSGPRKMVLATKSLGERLGEPMSQPRHDNRGMATEIGAEMIAETTVETTVGITVEIATGTASANAPVLVIKVATRVNLD
ncbi:hypothetical protein HMN09_00484300 [Mycena chlorophos]|uniref:CCHC-type domain-containing protein n=1 Tax=Mycena chlorophos TaxID=658473 RepID=A0A8H6WC48_MYCCL|nr:hypothetical protein HMN09_00484300 [Mycena chlorophos]